MIYDLDSNQINKIINQNVESRYLDTPFKKNFIEIKQLT